MKLRTRCDPYLATIRNAIQGVTPVELRKGLEQARYHVYDSLERGDGVMALTWLETLSDSAEAIPKELWALRGAIVRAVGRIKEQIGASA